MKEFFGWITRLFDLLFSKVNNFWEGLVLLLVVLCFIMLIIFMILNFISRIKKVKVGNVEVQQDEEPTKITPTAEEKANFEKLVEKEVKEELKEIMDSKKENPIPLPPTQPIVPPVPPAVDPKNP